MSFSQSVTSIGESAFGYAIELVSVDFEDVSVLDIIGAFVSEIKLLVSLTVVHIIIYFFIMTSLCLPVFRHLLIARVLSQSEFPKPLQVLETEHFIRYNILFQ